MTIACCKPPVFCEPSMWHASLPGKQSHVCNTAYNQLQENLIALLVTRLASTEAPVWSRLLLLTEKRKARGTFNSLSYAEKDYGLSQQLPRRGWVPGLQPWQLHPCLSRTIWCQGHRSSSLVCPDYGQLLGVCIMALPLPIPSSLPHVGSFFVSTIVCIISLFYLTTSKRSEKHYKNYTLIYFHLNMSLGISVRCSIL